MPVVEPPLPVVPALPPDPVVPAVPLPALPVAPALPEAPALPVVPAPPLLPAAPGSGSITSLPAHPHPAMAKISKETAANGGRRAWGHAS